MTLKERSAAQEHFLDLCALLNHPTPAADDPRGERFTFEAGASKTASGQGWAEAVADVSDEEILRRLLALNLERAGKQGG